MEMDIWGIQISTLNGHLERDKKLIHNVVQQKLSLSNIFIPVKRESLG